MALTTCDHLKQIKIIAKPDEVKGCDECLQIGSSWVEVRMCLTCGHVGCCDSSKHQHARNHYETTQHPIIQSVEPGQSWGWCYLDEEYLKELPAPAS
ncbi:MAG: UBP-type zinc finger domain-containing protein [Acidobacteria bacterium]|nr:UBP-type zinc finger domain-containing protein [Acidobacteriota bacterium]